jgi:hypothetical protein
VLLVLGGYGTANLSKLLTNRFSVPGSDAEKGLSILRSRFHELRPPVPGAQPQPAR